jgi:pyrroloquinoline-quinone synthase
MNDNKINQATAEIVSYADSIISKVGMIKSNPYFENLRSNTFDLEAFRRTQEQFYFAVLFFARPMAALVARFPDPRVRLAILHNVVEEHGDFNERSFHSTTFREFLKSISALDNRLDDIFLWSEVRAFNSVLATSCVLDEVEVAVGCMGVIEYAFSDISALIGKAVIDNGWVTSENLKHYKLHAEIDKRHAQEFFEVVAAKWSTGDQYHIKQGIELGVYIFNRLYLDLYQATLLHGTTPRFV